MSGQIFRSVVVVGVVVICLLGVLSLWIVFSNELTDRSIVVLTAVLGFLAPTIASLLVLLRVDATTEQVHKKVERVHYDMLNGPLQENVKKAITAERSARRKRRAELMTIEEVPE